MIKIYLCHQARQVDLNPSTIDPSIRPTPESDSWHQSYDKVTRQHSAQFPPPSKIPTPSNVSTSSVSDGPTSSSYPTDDYPAHNYHQPPPTKSSENHGYSQSYLQQPYQQEPQLTCHNTIRTAAALATTLPLP